MLDSSRERILSEVPDDALVLDIGGWGKPFPRADWVVDVKAYATRGLYGSEPGGDERFGPDTWVQRDICAAEPLPFDDAQFDFVVCSHTLEDVRDPVRVCAEIMRVGRAGYIEAPSRLEELSWDVHGPWVGWSHHHWLVEVLDGRLEFVFKPHVVHGRETHHFPDGFWETLAPDECVETLWWEGSFEARERLMADAPELDEYVSEFIAAELARRGFKPRRKWLS